MNLGAYNMSENIIFLSENQRHFAAQYPNLQLVRVVSQHHLLYQIVDAQNTTFQASLSGKLNYKLNTTTQYPAVGDYLMVKLPTNQTDIAIIEKVFPRTSLLTRGAKDGLASQAMAANVDTVFITVSLNDNFNLRRIERYLVIVADSHAKPVILLTKADQCPDTDTEIAEVAKIAPHIPIITTSLDHFESLKNFVLPGKTSIFIGSSGVGKSTIINHLLGYQAMTTSHIRESDSKGRHTTTTRQLFVTANSSIIIDTPGMRELQINLADITTTFEDIDLLTQQCRFRNCHHQYEPGCAIRTAIADGMLSEIRFQNYQKLQRESNYANLNNHDIEAEKFNRFYGSKAEAKRVNHYAKKKDKYKYRDTM
jgi:ribosome biogenesis GTPase